MAFKPIDPKRDEFRRYLEHAGVIEALTKVFVRLVKERPENPMEYLQHNLSDSILQTENIAFLQTELQESREEIKRLRRIIEAVNPAILADKKAEPQSSQYTLPNQEVTKGEDIPMQEKSAKEIEHQLPYDGANESEAPPRECGIDEAFASVKLVESSNCSLQANIENIDNKRVKE